LRNKQNSLDQVALEDHTDKTPNIRAQLDQQEVRMFTELLAVSMRQRHEVGLARVKLKPQGKKPSDKELGNV